MQAEVLDKTSIRGLRRREPLARVSRYEPDKLAPASAAPRLDRNFGAARLQWPHALVSPQWRRRAIAGKFVDVREVSDSPFRRTRRLDQINAAF